MKKENIQSPAKAPQREEDRWVDIHDEDIMVELGIRPKALSERDPSVWTKTPNEKRLLKELKHSVKGRIHFNSTPVKSIPVRSKLIIFLKKNNKYPKSVYSTECWQHEIGDIISRYTCDNKVSKLPESIVLKYSYNGKTYSPRERPFWPGK